MEVRHTTGYLTSLNIHVYDFLDKLVSVFTSHSARCHLVRNQFIEECLQCNLIDWFPAVYDDDIRFALLLIANMAYLGICQSDLVTVYLSVVRPVGLLEYDCPVRHTNSQHYTCQTFIRTIYVGFV